MSAGLLTIHSLFPFVLLGDLYEGAAFTPALRIKPVSGCSPPCGAEKECKDPSVLGSWYPVED